MKKNKEMKIYEALGIKKFRKFVIQLSYLLVYPINLLYKRGITFQESKAMTRSISSNYYVGSELSIDKIKKFKNQLWFNSTLHIIGILLIIKGMIISADMLNWLAILFASTFIILNGYCIMLQRYNYLRINNLLQRTKTLYDKKKNNEIEMLKKEDALIKDHSYIFINKKNKGTNVSLNDIINNASLEELQQCREYLAKLGKYDNNELSLKIKKKELKINFQ